MSGYRSYAKMRHFHAGISFVSVLLLCTVLFSGCGTADYNNSGAAVSKYDGAVTIVPNFAGPFTRNFNPFIDEKTSLSGTRGMIYETLLYFNRQNPSTGPIPWLASNYQWTAHPDNLTITLRPNVKWSDGQPFTSQDVIFTLQLLHEFPELDKNNLWKIIKDVSAPTPNTVHITFKELASAALWSLAGQTYIVPKHIWEHISNPITDQNSNPVGTGPFVLHSFDPTLYTLTRNPYYWQPGKPVVNELRYPAYLPGTNIHDFFTPGSIDWAGIPVPDEQQNFVNQAPNQNHFWLPATGEDILFLNVLHAPFNIQTVREVVSLAIDRSQIANASPGSYLSPASKTGLILPAQSSYLLSTYLKESFRAATGKAAALLGAQGYIKGNDGIYLTPAGQPVTFHLTIRANNPVWQNEASVIATNLQSFGFGVTITALSSQSYENALQFGNYDAAIAHVDGGISPYDLYNALLNSQNTAFINHQAGFNSERWQDQDTDDALAAYTGTTDPQLQQNALNDLENTVVNRAPFVPLVYTPAWNEYSTARFTGWPTPDNAYAEPSPYSYPDNEQVILHLQPVTDTGD